MLRYTAAARLRVDGSGIDGGATAADFGNLAGVIRAPELAAGRIDHALFLVIRCAASGNRFGFGTRHRGGDDSAWVYPASGGSAPCRDGSRAPPLGARLQLAMSERELNALPVPPWKRAILRALARYGAYVGDTGGPGVGLQIESSLTYTAFRAARSAGAAGAQSSRRPATPSSARAATAGCSTSPAMSTGFASCASSCRQGADLQAVLAGRQQTSSGWRIADQTDVQRSGPEGEGRGG